jgi:class 3 adenylate cyclase
MRAGLHTGEIEFVDDDIRGVTGHAASRIMAAANADEIPELAGNLRIEERELKAGGLN